jgi:pimeloyl-[acyl-carrier protein] methyl ester esterase
VAAAVPADAIWIGWSLGGLVALAAALGGARMRKLVLVGATPRFVQGPGWPYGIAPEVLDEFATELEIDYRATVQRFLALQARGSDRAREELRTLREKVFARGEPTHAALAGGLEILRNTDLRHTLNHIALPVLLLHGDKDRLVPLEAVDATAVALPDARVTLVAGAGHAPFLSHPAEFQGLLKNFIGE